MELTRNSDFNYFCRVEDLMAKVLYGEFRITTSGAVDMFNMFSSLYEWLSVGEMTGRFVFDLGQALYERGKPQIGKMMMQRGFETADVKSEGQISMEVIKVDFKNKIK
jgi:hypothetical protein